MIAKMAPIATILVRSANTTLFPWSVYRFPGLIRELGLDEALQVCEICHGADISRTVDYNEQ